MSQNDRQQDSTLTLVVDTPNGPYLRRIPDASPLVTGTKQGPAAEAATRSAVAQWGLPDFVYRPVIHQTKSGVRELGDALLLIGQSAVVIQVKSREAPGTDEQREKSWIAKATKKALSQAHGTVRSLRSRPATLVNLRDRRISIDGNEFNWLAVVIIDHPSPPRNMIIGDQSADLPSIALLRRDWEFLFHQLRSTHAVVAYLKRISTQEPLELGEEPVRYYQLAQADEDTPPSNMDPALVGSGEQVSHPLLPKTPVGHDDHYGSLVMRAMMEDIATSPISDSMTEMDRIKVLSELDQLPVAYRSELGRTLTEMISDVASVDEESIKWRFRRIRSAPGVPHLTFGACTRFDSTIREAFWQWVTLRHYEFGADLEALDSLITIGVLLTPRYDGLRPWDTTMVRIYGDLELTAEEHLAIRKLWSPSA